MLILSRILSFPKNYLSSTSFFPFSSFFLSFRIYFNATLCKSPGGIVGTMVNRIAELNTSRHRFVVPSRRSVGGGVSLTQVSGSGRDSILLLSFLFPLSRSPNFFVLVLSFPLGPRSALPTPHRLLPTTFT